MTTEIVKCGRDPVYFINSHCRIQHPTLGGIPFETYPFQDDCVHAFEHHRFNIILKSRQLGLSTICAAYATWLAIFHRDKNVLIIATKLSTATNMIKKIRYIIQNLPPWLLLTKFEPTMQSIRFSNGSTITATPTSEDAGRSEALSLLIVDEAALIRNFEDIWTGLAPTVSTGGSAIILSTPMGVGGQYYKMWHEAEAGISDFNPIRLPWDVHPEHDQAWYDKETKSLPRRKVSAEFDCDFLTSGDTFLQPAELDYLKLHVVDPMAREGFDRNIWVWNFPVAGHSYVISADISRGDAHDYSAFHVIDIHDCEVAAEYMGKVSPEKLADILAEWGHKYNDALIVAEHNTYGYFTNVKLRDALGYKKLYYRSNRGDPFSYVPINSDELPGFQTDVKTRMQILVKLEDLIRNKTLKTYSRRLYDQLQAFVWVGNKPQAGKDSYDDLVISVAIGCWLIEGGTGLSEQAKAMAYAMLAATHCERKGVDSMPGGINDAQPLVNPNIRGMNAQSIYRPRDPSTMGTRNPYQRDISDFSWLNK